VTTGGGMRKLPVPIAGIAIDLSPLRSA